MHDLLTLDRVKMRNKKQCSDDAATAAATRDARIVERHMELFYQRFFGSLNYQHSIVSFLQFAQVMLIH